MRIVRQERFAAIKKRRSHDGRRIPPGERLLSHGSFYSTLAPNGVRASLAILKNCFPKGMPTIVMHRIRPMAAFSTASGMPLTRSQKMFKIVEREDDIIANEGKVFDGFLRTINTEILGADLIDVGLILRALTVETLFVKIKVHLTKRFFILTERSFACNVFSCTF